MAKKDEDFLKKLLATFQVEAQEHVAAMSSDLIELEKAPAPAGRAQLVERIFREAHSLKGAARAVNLADIESVCHALESVFVGMRRGGAVSAHLFDLLHQALDSLRGLISSEPTETRLPLATLIGQLQHAAQKSPTPTAERSAPPASAPQVQVRSAAPAHQAPAPRGPAAETVRISSAKLDALLRQAEELLAARQAAGERARELLEAGALLAARNRKDAETQAVLIKSLEGRLTRLAKSAQGDHRALSGMVDELLRSVKEMQLLPLSSLLDTLAPVVRELARDRGKQVELSVRGGEIEIDRRILEQLKDPLIHLLRNSVDHGIETPPERLQKSKPPQGTIAVQISQKDGGKVEIAVADDGAGIDVGKLKAAAVKAGDLSAEEAQELDEREALELAFRSGVSTSPMITALSGRGLGLAIVREHVERLGGSIALETRVEAGTSFRIVLPLTLATFRGILVRAGERPFVIPTSSVDRVVRVAAEDVRTVENRATIALERQAVALARLSDVLELPPKAASNDAGERMQAVVLGSGASRIAFQVDEVLGEQEVLVKALGPQLARVRNVAGASVLGTGEVVPVLNVSDLMKSAAKTPARAPVEEQPAPAQKRSILVADDSITSRSLLKNILESAGYEVGTAVDGSDAYTALKAGAFDLLVSDVEMPRMDGFDLAARLRSDKRLAELPIVLVTALASREHRERGIEVGANAYIVKSSFDQSDLLQVIRRLLS